MDEWNVFGDSDNADLEHSLGKPMKEEKLCSCGDTIKNHDRLGCMAKGCECKITLHQLTFKER